MNTWHIFHGANAGYVLELYERFLADPDSVDEATRAYFAQWTPLVEEGRVVSPPALLSQPTVATDDKIAGVVNLANGIREFGHLDAQIDPLGTPPPGDPATRLTMYGLTPTHLDQLPGHLVGGPIGETARSAADAIAGLRAVYGRHVGYDFAHVTQPVERQWLRNSAESRRFHPDNRPIDPVGLLKFLTRVEGFELFLHRTFPGKTRFSIEGLDMLAPMLDAVIGSAIGTDIDTIMLGMAHRGRLNVLAHILDKPYAQILAEFKDPMYDHVYEGWTGDVKYHGGAFRHVDGDEDGNEIAIQLVPNPSHLELVNPVVEGMARAGGAQANQPGPAIFDRARTLPILIHGDAAFSGQGIVAETLNFAQLPGWRTGGTLHIIANNQVGFTTDQDEGRSTRYASDLAKGFKIPIVHVNADDPEACIEVALMALDYLRTFQKDILIDLVGYRRHGHNEGDEPRFTQPRMYAAIDALPSVRAQWAETLVTRGAIDSAEPERLLNEQIASLQTLIETLDAEEALPAPDLEPHPPGAARQVETAVSADTLRSLNDSLLSLPSEFTIHPRLKRVLRRRQTALRDAGEPAVDWGHAEALAFASLLADGVPIRLTGEDVERGTFSHRHMVLHDAETGATARPFQTLPQARASFEGRNSPLSENAAVGFEYGYSIGARDRLVLWEAQYGDFVNGAQPVIDEFVTSGHAKWGLESGLVLLLPHGHEGQGPDHSTGRLERFLQLSAEINLRIANPTTAAQYFHLLRRQAKLLGVDPLPLIVMTPKSLLRHKLAHASLDDLATGQWQPVLDDDTIADRRDAIRRLILCSGKVAIDLFTTAHRPEQPDVAVVRVEQLYRVPVEEISAVVNRYPAVEEIVWLQEEPRNMGAWNHYRPFLREIIDGRHPLRYIGRPRRASPAEGFASWHKVNQDELMRQAYAG